MASALIKRAVHDWRMKLSKTESCGGPTIQCGDDEDRQGLRRGAKTSGWSDWIDVCRTLLQVSNSQLVLLEGRGFQS